eukprot:4342763-Alexandrium_andersonii.AAC.1
MHRVQSALSGALPALMERNRFAQHSAALQLTPEQMAAFREPLHNDIAAALSQAVLRYVHD